MNNRYLCIHGHFYQPPRENAWLERVEVQDSAAPYHDWNERVAAECYGPNAASRILNEKKKIVDIVNNYEKISFDFGPTLLSWLEINKPEIYAAIIEADVKSRERQNGHGNAIAQVYNHLIMPLANRRDKITQILWGIADFEHRFKRKPEGMWLAETAVDMETLELMAGYGIKYTILAPSQIKHWRAFRVPQGDNLDNWNNTACDTTQAYNCSLPGGKSIAIFVYNGVISQKMAFDNLLDNGTILAKSLVEGFSSETRAQIAHVALDGETFGHHHKYGEMALSFCIDYIETNKLAQVINYGNFLELYPPEFEIEIRENSSWSCVHGVERWRSDCGCHTGGQAGWNQLWRAPLRQALDYLRAGFESIYEIEMSAYAHDIWALRDDYISVILDRSENSLQRFLKAHTTRPMSAAELTRFLRLIEMERHGLLMYTSCGWFFNDISGIETQQVLQYACRGIQLGEQMGNYPMTNKFVDILRMAESNIPSYGDGAKIYKECIQESLLSLSRIGLHYAVHALFEDRADEFIVLNYRAESQDYLRFEEGDYKLSIGETTVHSRITHSAKHFYFILLYLGQHHLIGSNTDDITAEDYKKLKDEIQQHFTESNIAMVLQTMETYFGTTKFSFWQLFKDEQLKVLNSIIGRNRGLTEDNNRENFNNNYSLINVLKNHNLPIPSALRKNLDLVLNSDLRRLFENGDINVMVLKNITEEVIRWKVDLDVTDIAFAAEINLRKMIGEFIANPVLATLNKIHTILDSLAALKILLNLWQIQNILFKWQGSKDAEVLRSKSDTALEMEFYRLADRMELSL